MNSRRGRGKPSVAGPSNSRPQGKGPGTQHGYSSGKSAANGTNSGVDQLSHGLANTSLASNQDGDWEGFTKKTKNRGNVQQWAPQNSTPNVWGCPNVVQKLGMGGAADKGKSAGGAWQTQGPRADAQGSGGPYDSVLDAGDQQHQSDVDDKDDDDDDETGEDDYDLMSDEFDSDCSVKSHDTRKKHPWFKKFFEDLDKLTVDQINDLSTPRHCPACRKGPGAIHWYRGLQPLIAHAKTKGAKRVKIHRELAEILEEELNRRGASVIPAGQAFGKWAGLPENVSDKNIVWPPMVVVMNTQLEMDEDDEKWMGMGNQELLDYFSAYTRAVKACHSYDSKGHRGMSILIFESSPVGYWEAEHLDKHFTEQSTGRYAWDHHGSPFKNGQRQLYGYMARKEDVDNFNKHSQEKKKLKFEVKSYQEMVVVPMRQMSEDNQQLVWLKNKLVSEQRYSKRLEKSLSVTAQKLGEIKEENDIVRRRTKVQHEQNKEEMDYQEQYFKKTLEEKEKAFEEKLQEERTRVKLSTVGLTTAEDDKLRKEEVDEFVQIQAKGIKELEADRENLIKHLGDKLKLDIKFKDDLTKLMEQYAPTSSEEVSATDP